MHTDKTSDDVRLLTASDPAYKAERRIEDIILGWFGHLYKTRNGSSLNPERLHQAFTFLLFRLQMGGIDVSNFGFYFDIVSGRSRKLDEILGGYVGYIFHLTMGTSSDHDYHFNGSPERALLKRQKVSCIEPHELETIQVAYAFATTAYRLNSSIHEIMKKAHIE